VRLISLIMLVSILGLGAQKMVTQSRTRGQRNNNPLNIRHNKANVWRGMSQIQADPSFVQFSGLAWGFRAAYKTLLTYINMHGLNTIESIIYRWAPPEDNNETDSYVEYVAKRTGIDKSAPLTQKDHLAVLQAMAKVESGAHYSPDVISQGMALI